MMKYNGKGFFGGDISHPRVPARDLSDKEVEKFGRDFLLSLGIYDEIPKKKEVKDAKQES
jgi:hypothetical protein